MTRDLGTLSGLGANLLLLGSALGGGEGELVGALFLLEVGICKEALT